MKQRRMVDSTDPAAIPRDAAMVAGYVDGRYRTVDQLRQRFPHAQVVTVTVLGGAADVADVETGDLRPDAGARWAAARVRAGKPATLYCNASSWPTVKRAVRKELGRRRARRVSWWIADYDGRPVVPRGAVAKQYADPKTSGGHYDLSVVADYWPGVDPVPATPLRRVSAYRARRLTRSLNRRRRRLDAAGEKVLIDLALAVDRVRKLR